MLSKVHQRERVTAKSPHGKLNYILVGHHELVTTGGVGGAPEADFAGYRGRGWRWRGRLDGSAGHLKQILPGIREEGGGGGDDWRGLGGTWDRFCRV